MAAADDAPAPRALQPTLETPALTKAELAELLFEQSGLNKRESKDMVEAFFDLIARQPDRRRRRQDVRLRQLPDPAQGAAARAQSAHRRGDPDQGAPRRDISASAKLKDKSTEASPKMRARVDTEPWSE